MFDEKCPFSKKAFDEGKVKVIKGDPQVIITNVAMWDDSYEVIVIKPTLGWIRWYDWCLKMESQFSKDNLIAIPNARDGYILLQRLDHLISASDWLEENTDYYENYTKEMYEHVERRRRLAEEWPRL